MNKPIILLSTFPDKKSLNNLAKKLIKNELCACVNFTKVTSMYTWKGKIENSSEYLALFKTTEKNKKQLKEKIKNSHPYEVPEIAEIKISSINKPYLDWIIQSTR